MVRHLSDKKVTGMSKRGAQLNASHRRSFGHPLKTLTTLTTHHSNQPLLVFTAGPEQQDELKPSGQGKRKQGAKVVKEVAPKNKQKQRRGKTVMDEDTK